MDVSARPALNQEIVNNRLTLILGLSRRETGVMHSILIRLLRGVDVEDRAELDLALAKIQKLNEIVRDVHTHGLKELVSRHCHVNTLDVQKWTTKPVKLPPGTEFSRARLQLA